MSHWRFLLSNNVAIGKLKRYLRNQFRFLFVMERLGFFFPYPSFNHIQSSPHEATAENVVQGPVIRGPTEFLFVWPWEKGRISIKILSWVPWFLVTTLAAYLLTPLLILFGTNTLWNPLETKKSLCPSPSQTLSGLSLRCWLLWNICEQCVLLNYSWSSAAKSIKEALPHHSQFSSPALPWPPEPWLYMTSFHTHGLTSSASPSIRSKPHHFLLNRYPLTYTCSMWIFSDHVHIYVHYLRYSLSSRNLCMMM